jgi:aspartyl-tRNA(Asn)/glutamyl-tRNA(Gln) amidotransferase subunit C
MRITSDEVRRIASLANLQVSSEEVTRLAADLDRILDYVAQLATLDVEGVEPAAGHPADRLSLRDDRPGGSLTPEESLANAPESDRGHFLVPRVIDTAGG